MPETKRPRRGEQRDGEQKNEIGEAESRLCRNFAQELSVIGQSAPVAKAGLDVMLGGLPVAKSLIDHSAQSSWPRSPLFGNVDASSHFLKRSKERL